MRGCTAVRTFWLYANTTVGNFLDRCAISLPIDVEGLPVGLMLMGEAMGDQALFAVARAVEAVLKR